MSVGATKLVWSNSSASNGSLLVLLAIADECGEGEFTEMKIADLALKCRLSDRAVRMAVKDLEALGELSVEGGRGAVGRYAVCSTSADSSDVRRQILPGTSAESAGPAKSAPRQNLPDPLEEPQVSGTPAKSAERSIPDALDLSSVVSGKRSRSKAASETPRPDVDRLCEHLARKIAERGSKRPKIGKRWRDAARLMIDNDGYTEEQIHAAIDWSQQHHFWHRNIMSMEKLRQQYDRLRLDAIAEKKAKPRQSRQQETDDLFDRAMARARRADAMEAGIEP